MQLFSEDAIVFSKNLFWNKNFLGLCTFSNVNVLHKGLLLQDWVFRLGMNIKIVSIFNFFVNNICSTNPFIDF